MLLFIILRRPQRSPLFPYTTLFRSSGGEGGTRAGRSGVAGGRGDEPADGRLLRVARGPGGGGAVGPWTRQAWGGGGDRKSTRLNSSHPSISYAVFCLKKKI